MKVMVFDLETNSLDTIGGYIMEIAWAVFDVGSWRCLNSHSSLIRWGKAYPVEKEASDITGLSWHFCEEHGYDKYLVFDMFTSAVNSCDYLCGHNAVSYDRPMMMSNIERAAAFSAPRRKTWENVHCIDTLLDCPYPPSQKILSLKYLALDHGYILSGAHEAIHDVFACAHILKQYPFQKVLEISKTPLVTLTAKIPWEDSQGREKIKNSKFYWNPKAKIWEKKIRQFWLPTIQEQLGTEVSLSIGLAQSHI